MTLRQRLWRPSAIVFLSSACIMIIELVASRLMAPKLGVSLYTWTSVIGVILAGISLGNYLGGRLADRWASSRLLGIVFALAALGSLSIIGLSSNLHSIRLPERVPLIAWVVAYIAAIFFVPSTILGCVSPIVVKLSLTDLRRTGTTVGRIYAWSSVGSIVGTFATGFWLISWFGTKTIVVMVAGLQLLMAIWFLTDATRRRALVSAAVCALAFSGAMAWLGLGNALARECVMETNYFCIKVHDTQRDGRTIRELVLDRLVHSYSDLEDPTHLVYGYEQTYAEVIRPMMAAKPDL
ncbi:MAG: spermidine synthase, partial [Chloroflexi bacterium]|nr:spermidine synthase [Chloroflexota bacterium]